MKRPLSALLPACFALLLSGCNLLPEPQADSTRHYVLESAVAANAPGGAPRLGLRRVEVPAYLKSKAIVTRTAGNELRYAATARWAEPLEAGIARVLRDQLGVGAVVSAYPFPAGVERDYDLVVRVVAAEGRDDGVRFTASYELVRVADSQVVARRTFNAPVAAWRGDHGELAAALSVAAAGLAGDILAALPAK